MIFTKKKIYSLIDVTNLCFLAVLVGFLMFIGQNTPYFYTIVALYVLFFFATRAVAIWRKRHFLSYRYANLILTLFPIVLFFFMYSSISGLIGYFVGGTYDQVMEQFDCQLFAGTSPSLWIQQYYHPWLTECMYILYLIYFPMPIVLVIYLYRTRNWKAIEISLMCLFICYYGAFITYFFVPVLGPRFYLKPGHTEPLQGLLFSEPIRQTINFFEPTKLDCFPSLHTAILIVTVMLCHRYHKGMYYWFATLGVGILISLVYLRYHYVADVIIGIIWAVASVCIGYWLHERYHRRFVSQFQE